jgi:hypothetical protein
MEKRWKDKCFIVLIPSQFIFFTKFWYFLNYFFYRTRQMQDVKRNSWKPVKIKGDDSNSGFDSNKFQRFMIKINLFFLSIL